MRKLWIVATALLVSGCAEAWVEKMGDNKFKTISYISQSNDGTIFAHSMAMDTCPMGWDVHKTYQMAGKDHPWYVMEFSCLEAPPENVGKPEAR